MIHPIPRSIILSRVSFICCSELSWIGLTPGRLIHLRASLHFTCVECQIPSMETSDEVFLVCFWYFLLFTSLCFLILHRTSRISVSLSLFLSFSFLILALFAWPFLRFLQLPQNPKALFSPSSNYRHTSCGTCFFPDELLRQACLWFLLSIHSAVYESYSFCFHPDEDSLNLCLLVDTWADVILRLITHLFIHIVYQRVVW